MGRLKRDWYDRLAKSGFRDIEAELNDANVVNVCAATKYKKENKRCDFERIRYYSHLALAANHLNTKFRNDADKHILTRFADGAYIRDIVLELNELGIPRDRKTVRIIIRRYEMAWGIKNYTRKQLNRKKME